MVAVLRNGPELWGATFPWPKPETHKYARGELLLWGGARMTGAARLAARGAMRIGVGLVRVACPGEAGHFYGGDLVNAIVEPDGAEGFKRLLHEREPDAVLVGPGAGRGDEAVAVLKAALEAGTACLFDGDALSELASQAAMFAKLHARCVLTPHEGEFRRLFPDLQGDRPDRARNAARQCGAVVVLKGDVTHVAHPDGRVVAASKSTPFLATAGSGDVLSGLAAGLLAQGMDPFDAANAAVWIHKECAAVFGPGLIASDLPDLVPRVLAALAAGSGE